MTARSARAARAVLLVPVVALAVVVSTLGSARPLVQPTRRLGAVVMQEIDDQLEEQKAKANRGALHTELRMIAKAISRRSSGQATNRERERILKIREELKG